MAPTIDTKHTEAYLHIQHMFMTYCKDYFFSCLIDFTCLVNIGCLNLQIKNPGSTTDQLNSHLKLYITGHTLSNLT